MIANMLGEGFFDCIKVVQAEHVCVALMGCSMSDDQEELLVRHFRQVVITLDGDEAGRRAADEIAGRLAHKVWVRLLDLPEVRTGSRTSSLSWSYGRCWEFYNLTAPMAQSPAGSRDDLTLFSVRSTDQLPPTVGDGWRRAFAPGGRC